MSSDLVSQFPVSDRKVVRMEHPSSSMDFPVSEMRMKMQDNVSNNPESHHFSVSEEQMSLLEPMSSPVFKTSMIINNQVGQSEFSGSSLGSNPIWMSNQLGREAAVLPNNPAGEKALLPVKRKAEVEPMFNNSVSQQSLLPTKLASHKAADVNSFGHLRPSAPQKRTATTQSKLGSPGLQAQPLLNKKVVRSYSMSGKNGSEAVRSKMKESLSTALEMAIVNQHNVSSSQKDQTSATIAHSMAVDPCVSESNLAMGSLILGTGSEEVFSSKEPAVVGENNDGRVLSAELPPNGNNRNAGQTFQEFQYGSVLPDEDVTFSDSFFVKDDLLQGNGLSWAFDFDVQMREGTEAQNSEKPKSVENEAQGHRDGGDVATLTPENLAFKIEAELFKLFGGVNKKYKEKGRSLLFNLKDRNNPELRERVMSGEISPERLCSMSAEELASKELSEWRIAKAEELAQMVVLPDTEVDIRRLVKKTHKGEYQVEVDRYDVISAEVSGGTSMLTQPQPRKVTETQSPSVTSPKDKENVAGQRSSSENHDLSGSLIIQTDGTDLMQGMMVDELKDAEFLPPIVSLDEFMESLNSEPPFENLSSDAGQKTPTSHKESPEMVNNSRAPRRASISPKGASSKKADVVKKHEVVTTVKSIESPAKQKVLPSISSRAEYVWEGILQLNVSSSITVGGLFQSGEKTSTKEWPTSLEIKGRVRLDSFEKFLRELPMSRTRAVMVLQFDLRDKSSKTERSNLSEAVDSYAADERLGYAEPGVGVELYLCPPTSRISDVLNKHVPRELAETNNLLENGLIGVVVWRRAHISNKMSPNSFSHNKHGLKRQHFAPSKRMQDSSNVNVNTPTRAPPPVFNNAERNIPESQPDENDDIPPGFGPMAAARSAAKDDDDLPEFNFSDPVNPHMPRISPQNLHHGVKSTQRSVDQVRELIKKYGQSGSSTTSRTWVDNRSLGIKPWNDDNDDIPEWQPQASILQHHQPYPVVQDHRVQDHRPPLQMLPNNAMTQQPPRGLAHPLPGGRWVQPTGPQQGARGRQL